MSLFLNCLTHALQDDTAKAGLEQLEIVINERLEEYQQDTKNGGESGYFEDELQEAIYKLIDVRDLLCLDYDFEHEREEQEM